MSKQSGRYNLVREDIDNEYVEFFDFESMSFVNKITKGVDISTIDSMTTLFVDENDFMNYFDKIKNNDEYNYKYKIIYTTNKSREEKVLKIVWDDARLNSISKLADGKVDFASDYNFSLFLEILEEIKKKNGLTKRISTSKKESFKLNEQNRKIIEIISGLKVEVPIKDLIEVFSDYKEYRALYLNYKYYLIEKENSLQKPINKIKKLFKGE